MFRKEVLETSLTPEQRAKGFSLEEDDPAFIYSTREKGSCVFCHRSKEGHHKSDSQQDSQYKSQRSQN